MRIALIRHGETIENRNKIIQGHSPGMLTEEGRAQVKTRCIQLTAYSSFDLILSSDLQRARDSALIAAEIFSCPIQFTHHLRERCYGALEGKPVEQLLEMMKQRRKNQEEVFIPDAERFFDFEQRVLMYYSDLIHDSFAKNVFLVTHAGVIRVILNKVTRMKPPPIKNVSGYLLTIDEDRNAKVSFL